MSLFRRRKKKGLSRTAREFLWPRMGWRRMGRYYVARIKRLPGTPYSIAAGFACGAAVSFTPFLGFHFIFGALLAWGIRGSIIASAIGTAIGNPWTFPFIWAGVYWLGSKILGYEPGQELPAELTFSVIFEEPTTILIPMLAGGVPAALVVWVIFFIPLRRLISNYQHHRRAARLKRQQVLAAERRARERVFANSNEDVSETAHAIDDSSMMIPEPDRGSAPEKEENPAIDETNAAMTANGRART